jgi:DNA polymerase-3 subunit gamma/tau
MLRETCTEMNIQAEDEALFWIAREATGSMRDAYTLFDQVLSFSAGNLRSSLIKEKLGLVGIEELNALADACADNGHAAAFEVIDRILDAGISIDQFVIDLAGYYRSLLLLKAGVVKESLLGYNPERFSSKLKAKLDLPQLEEALSLLLDLYRDMRYSLSPRFELETAVSKLCWMDRWISPLELRNAVDSARAVLGVSGISPPNFEKAGFPSRSSSVPKPSAGSSGVLQNESAVFMEAGGEEAPMESAFMDRPGAFTEGFKKMLAQKSELKQKEETIPEDVEMVRRVFRGTVVNAAGGNL